MYESMFVCNRICNRIKSSQATHHTHKGWKRQEEVLVMDRLSVHGWRFGRRLIDELEEWFELDGTS
jgi:hypothetical protein